MNDMKKELKNGVPGTSEIDNNLSLVFVRIISENPELLLYEVLISVGAFSMYAQAKYEYSK